MGCGRIAELAAACDELSINNPMIVTDAALAKLDILQQASAAVTQAGKQNSVFSEVKPNPNGENVAQGVNYYKQHQHDGVIAFGGGSALDAAKAIALMVGQQRELWDFEDVGDNWTRVNPQGVAPIIAVPTTAGTGSEVGRASVIVDQVNHAKKIIFHPKMLPALVIADPELCYGLPPAVTAATGMDALSHNLEAYCAPGYHPMADGIAIEAMAMIKANLPLAFEQPRNADARSHMLVASSMGATAFQKGLGAMHALAHPLGAIYDAHHGLLNAVLMPYVLHRNRDALQKKMQKLARCLDLAQPGFDGVMQWILDLRQSIGIANDLTSIGIDDQRVEEIAAMAKLDPSDSGNPVTLSVADYRELLSKALSGRLSD
jgi:hypothetical protein